LSSAAVDYTVVPALGFPLARSTMNDHPKHRLDELLPGPWSHAQASA
jgi:hypothetical protein